MTTEAATTPSPRLRMSMIRVAQQPLLFCLVLLLVHTSFALSTSTTTTTGSGLSKVAVIGTTGRLGRLVVQQLSSMGIQTRCLLRHDLTQLTADDDDDDSVVVVNSLQEATTSKQVAAYLKTLPGVEMIPGDVTDIHSLRRLLLLDNTADVHGCVDACLAVHGAGMPKPFFKGLFPAWFPESDVMHPKQINYHGVQNILTVLQECNNNNNKNKNQKKSVRLVRITGKGETPWSMFSILINAFGGMAKAWNYEAEQLIRSTSSQDNNIDYTIIRPGILKDTVQDEKEAAISPPPTLGFKENGGDLPVTAVSYQQIAQLVIDVAMRDNCKRATITAMNIKPPSSSTSKDNDAALLQQYQTLDQVQPDSRTFPTSLLQEHKRAARVGGITIIVFTMFMANLVASLVLQLFGFS